ncbi:FkbM family methyltransferase [Pedobacter aquatilis]|uniref:FkbM family methyltransferase n=1 Tax=Pedobacter aquatilis TaxID=351343 RepID=UPI002930340B|nr:FkbM family methyltransferase [Pedobacter aquatilis]
MLINRIYFKLKRLFHKDEYWETRIKKAISSPDNIFIHRVKNAGKVKSGIQIMHNGLKILKGSYYGAGITDMLKRNRGVHEPQEERFFGEVLSGLSENPVMIELGSYWAFYSMWFLKETKGGKAFLFEPDMNNLNFGISNFEINNFVGDFNLAMIGKKLNLSSLPPVLNIDFIMEDKKIDFLDILHCDIQGFECQMLEGAVQTLSNKKVGYIFISTHSNEIHDICVKFLLKLKYLILFDCNLEETYSFDGLIVAKINKCLGLDDI